MISKKVRLQFARDFSGADIDSVHDFVELVQQYGPDVTKQLGEEMGEPKFKKMVEGLLVPKERAAANVKRIMEAGFPPSYLYMGGVPVFSWFIHVGNREGVRAMLQAGLDPYTIDGGWPVRSAINEDRLEILGDIVDAGFGFDYESTGGSENNKYSTVIFCIERRKVMVFKLMSRPGARMSPELAFKCIHAAIVHYDAEMMDALLSVVLDVNLTKDTVPIMHIALSGSCANIEAAKKLAYAGYDVRASRHLAVPVAVCDASRQRLAALEAALAGDPASALEPLEVAAFRDADAALLLARRSAEVAAAACGEELGQQRTAAHSGNVARAAAAAAGCIGPAWEAFGPQWLMLRAIALRGAAEAPVAAAETAMETARAALEAAAAKQRAVVAGLPQ